MYIKIMVQGISVILKLTLTSRLPPSLLQVLLFFVVLQTQLVHFKIKLMQVMGCWPLLMEIMVIYNFSYMIEVILPMITMTMEELPRIYYIARLKEMELRLL